MKVLLMHKDRDFADSQDISPAAQQLIPDLELDSLFGALARGDDFLLGIVKTAMLATPVDPETIHYRQEILRDCMSQPDTVKGLYAIALEAIAREKGIWGWMSDRYPESTLHRSVELLGIFVDLFKRLRHIADTPGVSFRSEGLTRFLRMLSTELDDAYLDLVRRHLEQLRFRRGILMSAALGKGAKSQRYTLRKPFEAEKGWTVQVRAWWDRLSGANNAFTYEVDSRDEAGLKALSELRTEGIGHVAAALGKSADHVMSFFRMLRRELGFYIGCLNLQERLAQKGEPICFPEATPNDLIMLSAHGLYDVCLSLQLQTRVVGNDVDADNKMLTIITGANRGGKSTLLRSIGLAQLMMQCGMFVPAESFRANVCRGIYSHFVREEDTTMRSGKLDEEMSRMSAIVDALTPGCMVLLNESFSSTNEREGSEIARQIVSAFLSSDVKVVYVTHMFDLANGFYREERQKALFLRAERSSDGPRTFRVGPGQPLSTSHGEDLYHEMFHE